MAIVGLSTSSLEKKRNSVDAARQKRLFRGWPHVDHRVDVSAAAKAAPFTGDGYHAAPVIVAQRDQRLEKPSEHVSVTRSGAPASRERSLRRIRAIPARSQTPSEPSHSHRENVDGGRLGGRGNDGVELNHLPWTGITGIRISKSNKQFGQGH